MEPAAAISVAIEAVKAVKSFIDKTKDAEMKSKLADALTGLADAKIALSELKEENYRLQVELRDMKRSATMEPDVTHRGDSVWLTNPKSGQKPGPYCETCYMARRQLIPLKQEESIWHDSHGTHSCGQCRTWVGLSGIV